MKLFDGGASILIACAIIGTLLGGRELFAEPKIAVTQQLGEGRSVTCYVPQSKAHKDSLCVGGK